MVLHEAFRTLYINTSQEDCFTGSTTGWHRTTKVNMILLSICLSYDLAKQRCAHVLLPCMFPERARTGDIWITSPRNLLQLAHGIRRSHLWIQPTSGATHGYRGWLYCVISYKGLTFEGFGTHGGVLEPVLREFWGMTTSKAHPSIKISPLFHLLEPKLLKSSSTPASLKSSIQSLSKLFLSVSWSESNYCYQQ